ncbi:hypothetical protein DFJ77DRAFT_210152 [Powellomyces hirtus]|nr:hypothetical protein DFJ77DRAFT_210152 [Powellomyces hirtus]
MANCDNGYPSIYIESLEVESIMGFDSVAGTWVARRIAQIKWQTLHIYGEQSYNITLYNGNETIGMYTDITYKSASIFFNSSAPLLVSENFTAAISVSTFTKDTLPPKNVSVIINNDDPDLSTCAESVITFPLGMSAGPAVAQVDWTKCVSPIREIDQWVYWIMPYMSVIDSTLKNTTVAKNVTKIAVPIEVTHQMIYKVCVGALDSYGNGTYAFCTENTLVDLTPPEPSGSVRDVDVNLGLPVASAVNTTSLRFQWDPWVDAESGIANYTLTVNCSGSAATQSISIPAQATDYTLYLSDPTIWLSPFNATAVMPEGTKCVGILLATNNAGLNSEPFTSPGITSVARTPAAEQYLSVLDGTVMQTSNYTWHFFPLLPNVTAHLGWGSIVEYNKSSASISFAVALTNMLDATDIHSYYFQNSVDAVIPLPQQAAVYSASLSIYIGGERARTLMSADSIAVIEGGPVTLPTLTSLNNYCEVDLNTINEGAPGQALFVPTVNISTVSAFWPPFVDTFGIIDRLQLAFRQKTKPDQTSNWVDAVLPKNATGFEGRVTWIYGVPEVLWSQEMECVLQAIDIIGNVTTLIMPGYLTSYPWFNPTVVDLSNWALLGTPVSATDYDFYSDIAVTPNSTYSVGFAGFPDLILNDKVLATVQFSVGNAYSPNAPTVFDNLLPPTFMDVRKISLTSMNVADNIIPFRFFSIPNFILPENELVHACINVTNVASGNSTAACTDGIIYSPDAPVQGNVYIKTSNNYITTSTSIQISWSGFYARGWLDAEDLGIARFEWSVGTYVGWDDVVTRRSVSSTQQTAVAQDLDLVAGDEIYATVTAYSHAGVPISSYSSPAVIDWSAPVSKGGFTKIKNMRERDGTYTLDVSYDEFVDLESEVRVVYLILETEYGLEDVIPPTKAITPRYTYATGLHLASGTPYVLRLVAVNGAGMRQEISASVTPETAVRLLYLYDYRAGGTWTAVANSSTSYTFSWVVSGSPLYFEVAAGTIPHQHDVMGWTRVDGLSRNFTLDLTAFPINDGEILYATIHAFNQAGLLADVAVTSGLTMDSSPPVLGRIVQGDTPFIHSPYANHFEFVQCSWTGFMDVHSEIVLYEACVDTNGNHTDLMASCSNLDWTPVDSSMTVQELALETHLEQGKHYYLKLRVTNAAGSPAIGVSPMFTADAERPVGQFITVGFPSKEAQRAGMNGGYFEQTIIQVEWQFAPPPISGIGQYIVGIYGQDGAIPVTTPAQIPGGLNRWTFSVDAKSLPEPLVEGVAYIAVARAVSGSGVIGDLVTEPFTIFTTAPSVTLPAVSFQNYANGTTSYFNDTTNTTEYTTTGNATIDVVVSNIGGSTQSALAPASYFVALGSYEYGTDIAMRTLNDTCGGSCDTTFTVPAKNYTLYWATVYSMDYAGLQSNPVSTSSFWDTGSPVGLLTNSVSWTITSVKPSAVDFNATAPTSIAVTGTGLSSLVASGYSGTITCNFEYPQSPGTVSSVPATLSTVDTVAQISCTPPSLQSSGLIPMNLTEGYVSLVIATGGSSTLAFNVFHKSSSNTAWGVGSQAVLGLSPFNNAYLPTPWSWHLTWPQELPSNDIAYYTVVGFGETYSTVLGIQNYSLFTISPTAPQAVNAQPGLFQWQVCSHPFLNVSSPSCIPSNTGLVDTMVASINPLVNTGYDDDIPTAVRITGAWADMAFDYESGGGYQSNASGIAANWTDSFVFANPSNKTINHFDVGAGYKPYRFDMNMSATGLSGTLGTATFMADLVPGVPFYVTLVVWDSAGLPSAYVSAPLILDTTAASL